MSKLDEKKKKKREALFTAAFHLFNTKGIRQTSISDIAQEASVAKGTFYLYFKDKFDLRDKLIAEKASQILMQAADETRLDINRMDNKSLEDEIIELVDVILDRMEREPQLLRFITKNLSWGAFRHISIEDGERESMPFYDGYHRMIANSGRKIKNPDLMLFMIVELVSGCCYQVILHGQPVSLADLKGPLYQAIRGIIRDQEEAGEAGVENKKIRVAG
ncbi:MAG: TetR/AcrR family transcriptional regulator [Eubacterium sp.]|nr:TetR/AcrR family transcriptional regulator [Eubacterium sp.]